MNTDCTNFLYYTVTTSISTAIYEPLTIHQVIFCIKSFSPQNNPRKEGDIILQNLAAGSLSNLVKSQPVSGKTKFWTRCLLMFAGFPYYFLLFIKLVIILSLKGLC